MHVVELTPYDNRPQYIAIGHLSDSGDLTTTTTIPTATIMGNGQILIRRDYICL